MHNNTFAYLTSTRHNNSTFERGIRPAGNDSVIYLHKHVGKPVRRSYVTDHSCPGTHIECAARGQFIITTTIVYDRAIHVLFTATVTHEGILVGKTFDSILKPFTFMTAFPQEYLLMLYDTLVQTMNDVGAANFWDKGMIPLNPNKGYPLGLVRG